MEAEKNKNAKIVGYPASLLVYKAGRKIDFYDPRLYLRGFEVGFAPAVPFDCATWHG
jgi:hypothetical protein